MTSRLLLRGFIIALLVACFTQCGTSALARDPAAKPSRLQKVDHWAFQPVRRPRVPCPPYPRWVRTPIDAFVSDRLEKEGVQPAPSADPRTLLRRVYLDLIGIPPTPEEQRAFLADSSPDAYERVVDRLLSHPGYGERWARHWLDVVRYAESNGYERDDAKPHAWRYRDYVIDSLNKDKSYDRFLLEQLAGDEIEGFDAESQIATTFLRLGTWDDEPADPLVDRYDQLDDVLGTSATAFLGLTLRCARCHDHKFEPFLQTDYYSLLAVFEPLKRPQKDRMELDRHVGTEAELAAYDRAFSKTELEITAIQHKMIDKLKSAIQDRLLDSALGKTPGKPVQKIGSLPADAIAAFRTEPAKRTTAQKELVKKYHGKLDEEIRKAESAREKVQREACEKQIALLKANLPKEPVRGYIWYEEGPKTPVSHVLHRGDPTRPLAEVQPALPAVLVRKQPEPPKPSAKSTGRRLWLARWMTSPENPLAARVIVNRAWQHHFGEGLVATENDFGVMGQAPSDPAFLDWLAAEFMAGGWRLKPLHRMIVLSSAYRMAAVRKARSPTADTDGTKLARWRQRRLEAEVVRDAILAVSGRLNPQMKGPSMYPTIPRAVLEGQSKPGDGWGKSDERQASRRSIYIFAKRSLAVPELDLLDAPDSTISCEQRAVSTTGPQALTFLNGDFVHQQAHYFAQRLVREAGRNAKAQIQRAFELAFCRPPRPDELDAAVAFLGQQQKQIETDAQESKAKKDDPRQRALEDLCLVLFNANEFVYLN